MMILAARAATSSDTGFVGTLHRGFFTVVVIYAALISLWGLFLYVRGSNPSGGYLGSLVIMEGVALFQGLIGLILLALGHAPNDKLHYLYGVVLALTLPVAWLYSTKGTERRDSLIFGLAGIFMIAIAIRASTTGGG